MEPNISALIVAIKSIETHISDRANSLIIRMPLLAPPICPGLRSKWGLVSCPQ